MSRRTNKGKTYSKPLGGEHIVMTHDEIAVEINTTRAAVAETYRRALAKCRRFCDERGITFNQFLDSIVIGAHEGARE